MVQYAVCYMQKTTKVADHCMYPHKQIRTVFVHFQNSALDVLKASKFSRFHPVCVAEQPGLSLTVTPVTNLEGGVIV